MKYGRILFLIALLCIIVIFTQTPAPSADCGASVVCTLTPAAINQTSAYTLSSTSNAFTGASYTGGAANPSSTGVLRLSNTQAIGWRNNVNSGDVSLTVNASNQFIFGGSVDAGSGDFLLTGAGLLRMGSSLFSRFGANGTNTGTFSFANAATGGNTTTLVPGLKALPNNTATIFMKITMTSGGQIGGMVSYSIEDLTTRGAIAGSVAYAAQDTAGTITCAIKNASSDQQTIGGSAGFVNSGFTCADAGSNVLNLLGKSLTTGGTDSLQIRYTLLNNGTGTVTSQ